MASWRDELRRRHHHNTATIRHSPLSEASGALGDLGTLLPFLVALAVQGSISLSTTLVFTGVFNVVTGVVFGIPLPVQPMKVRVTWCDQKPSRAGINTEVGLRVLLVDSCVADAVIRPSRRLR